MSKIRTLISIVLFGALFVPLVESVSDCPCSLPGGPGTLIKFVARNGTTENITFYTEFQNYKTGDLVRMWAAKKIDRDVVPVENLYVKVYFDEKIVYETITNEDGLFTFTPPFGGGFEVSGGDAILVLSVEFSEEEKTIEKVFDILTSIFGLPKNAAVWTGISVS